MFGNAAAEQGLGCIGELEWSGAPPWRGWRSQAQKHRLRARARLLRRGMALQRGEVAAPGLQVEVVAKDIEVPVQQQVQSEHVELTFRHCNMSRLWGSLNKQFSMSRHLKAWVS